MDNQTRNLLGVTAITLIVLYIFKPKNSTLSFSGEEENKYSSPMTADAKKINESNDASIALQAMKEAIQSGENKAELDKLNRILFNEHGLKVVTMDNNKLAVRNRSGKTILKEK
jgi:hypothetical protein